MSAPAIHGKRRTVSASKLLGELGKDLGQVRADDSLTWVDVGRVLGKSDDQAAKYADGSAEMPVTAFLFGRAEWGSRFTGRVDALTDIDRCAGPDDAVLPSVLDCARGIAEAARDGRICTGDIHENRKEIEEAIGALQGLLQKLDGDDQ